MSHAIFFDPPTRLIGSRGSRGDAVAVRRAPVPAEPPQLPEERVESSLELGVRDIRRMDRGFDPGRFVGYAGMVFRAVYQAWTKREIGGLRDRLTPDMHRELVARCDRLRAIGHASRVEYPEITAEVTDAWQEGDRDYLTAYIAGSMVDYVVDEKTGGIVAGSQTVPRDVEEFWTFTRPSGLNFWMLSAIQTS